MDRWAHQEAVALLHAKVAAGHLSGEAVAQVRQHLEAGEPSLALRQLASYPGGEMPADN